MTWLSLLGERYGRDIRDYQADPRKPGRDHHHSLHGQYNDMRLPHRTQQDGGDKEEET